MNNSEMAISSPCILVCVIDQQSGYCFGCGRTTDEIASWVSMTEDGRARVLAELPGRMEGIERKPRRETRRSRMARERGGAS